MIAVTHHKLPPGGSPRVLFLGMRSAFSRIVLDEMLRDAQMSVVAVGVPAPALGSAVQLDSIRQLSPPLLPMLGAGATVVDRAAAHGVPIYEISRTAGGGLAGWARGAQPDIIAVACFPWRLPADLLAVPTLGALNAHPSLLPRGRGPAPEFWSLRRGEGETGVTIHLMTEALDAGPVVSQERVAIPTGISGTDLEECLARVAGRLMLEAINSLATGTARPRPQDADAATYDPWPTDADFELLTDRSAMWAYSFVRGVDLWRVAPWVRVGDRIVRVRRALAFDAHGHIPQPILFEGERVLIQFTPGVLIAERYPEEIAQNVRPRG